MSNRPRKDAYWLDSGDDAIVRSVSRAAPCGRKESGDDGRGTRCGSRRNRCGGCGCAAVAEPADQAEKQNVAAEADDQKEENRPKKSPLIYPLTGHQL